MPNTWPPHNPQVGAAVNRDSNGCGSTTDVYGANDINSLTPIEFISNAFNRDLRRMLKADPKRQGLIKRKLKLKTKGSVLVQMEK